MKNVFNWLELPANNIYRARDFYSAIFRADMHIVEAEDTYMSFLPHETGGVGGAVVEGPGYVPSDTGIIPYLNAGDDLRVILQRVVPAGGEILQERTAISERHGYMALFMDSEGNRIGLYSRY